MRKYFFLLIVLFTLCCKTDEPASKKDLQALEQRIIHNDSVLKKDLQTLEQRIQCLEEAKAHPPLETPIDKIKKAIIEVKEWAISIQSFSTDYNKYPSFMAESRSEGIYKFCEARLLGPQLFDYKPSVPLDPWGNPYLYWCDKKRSHYLLVCTGSDGKLAFSDKLIEVLQSRMRPLPQEPQIASQCIQDDIIWCDSSHVQWPADNVEDCSKKGDK